MDFWLFNCKKVSRLVSDSMDRDLGTMHRLGIRFHLMMCRYCARYARQLRLIRNKIRSAVSEKDPPADTLSEETKKRLQKLIKDHIDQH
jgi:hypothetical protein